MFYPILGDGWADTHSYQQSPRNSRFPSQGSSLDHTRSNVSYRAARAVGCALCMHYGISACSPELLSLDLVVLDGCISHAVCALGHQMDVWSRV